MYGRLFLSCFAWAALAAGDQSEMDREIIKDLDFFYHLDVVEAQPMLEEGATVEKDAKGASNEEK